MPERSNYGRKAYLNSSLEGWPIDSIEKSVVDSCCTHPDVWRHRRICSREGVSHSNLLPSKNLTSQQLVCVFSASEGLQHLHFLTGQPSREAEGGGGGFADLLRRLPPVLVLDLLEPLVRDRLVPPQPLPRLGRKRKGWWGGR